MHRVFVAILGIAFLVPSTARAGSILFAEGTGAGDAVTLNAVAKFEVLGGNLLKITLRNTGDTSGSGKDKAANTLTGVFFDMPTGYTLAPQSATVRPGAIIQP